MHQTCDGFERAKLDMIHRDSCADHCDGARDENIQLYMATIAVILSGACRGYCRCVILCGSREISRQRGMRTVTPFSFRVTITELPTIFNEANSLIPQ